MSGCGRETYVSGGKDGDDGPYVVRAECNGPPLCGWSVDLVVGDLAWGLTHRDMATLDQAHRDGDFHPAVRL